MAMEIPTHVHHVVVDNLDVTGDRTPIKQAVVGVTAVNKLPIIRKMNLVVDIVIVKIAICVLKLQIFHVM